MVNDAGALRKRNVVRRRSNKCQSLKQRRVGKLKILLEFLSPKKLRSEGFELLNGQRSAGKDVEIRRRIKCH